MSFIGRENVFLKREKKSYVSKKDGKKVEQEVFTAKVQHKGCTLIIEIPCIQKDKDTWFASVSEFSGGDGKGLSK